MVGPTGLKSELLYHVDNGEGDPGSKRNLTLPSFDVTTSTVEGHSGQRGPHLQPPETRRYCSCLTNLENPAPDPPARPVRVYEESPYLGRIMLRIQKRIFTAGAVVASKERLALAPASAAGYDLRPDPPWLRPQNMCRPRSTVYPLQKPAPKPALSAGRIVARLQAQDGRADELLEHRNVGHDSLSDHQEHGLQDSKSRIAITLVIIELRSGTTREKGACIRPRFQSGRTL